VVRASLDRLAAASVRQGAALAKLLGLGQSDVLALQHVIRAGQVTPGALATRMQLSSGGTSALINRLCDRGLVAREPDPSNRRHVILHATERVEPLVAQPLAPLVADIDALLAELSALERAAVERFLARVADLCGRHADRLLTEAEAAARAAADVPSPVLWG
jgi:DNA-binding MarR family transcriptional regulator